MSDTFTWWQLSDIHWGRSDPPPVELQNYAAAVVAELSGAQLAAHGIPDAIIITGDLTFSGKREQYESLHDHLIAPLRAGAPELADVPIMMVPGNHDLDRDVAENLNSARVQGLTTPTGVDAFLADQRHRDLYLQPFGAFSEFQERVSPGAAQDAFSWTQIIAIGDSTVELVGINSAWSCFHQSRDDEVEERRLLIGSTQIPQRSPNSTAFRFLLTHHPFSWINSGACQPALNRIRNNFNMVLSGHVHNPQELFLTVRSNGSYCDMPSPLLCDRPYDGDSLRYFRGFAVGVLNTRTSAMDARYFRYNEDTGWFMENGDLYPPGRSSFSVELSSGFAYDRSGAVPRSAAHELEHSSVSLEFKDAAAQLRSYLSISPRMVSREGNALDAFRDIFGYLISDKVKALAQLRPQALAFAAVCCEQTIARRVVGLPGRSQQPAMDLVLSDFTILGSRVPEVTTAELDIIKALAQTLLITDPDTLVDSADRAREPVVLVFLFLWGLAQTVLLLDHPELMPGAGEEVAARPNILSTGLSSESGRIWIRLATDERSEFHLIAEINHAFERFMEIVEDLWRRAHAIAPPVRLDLQTPRWRYRTLQSHSLKIDPRPVTRLLMGKTLYGDRRHVWLRELLQNAQDAVEMRRTVQEDGNYEPQVDIEMVDSRTIIVRDNGIGMSYQYITAYLATLGRSGWRVQGKDDSSYNAFFGRFGIGFASVFSEARSVDIKTRPAGSRGVEGYSVRFSSPDRPFFIEPAVCAEGTEITVRLTESLTSTAFSKLINDLFVYLPSSVHVRPEVNLPDGLSAVSGAGRVEIPPSTAAYVEEIFEVEVDDHPARMKIELLDTSHYERQQSHDKQSGGQRVPSLGGSQFTICVDGVHVQSKAHLDLKQIETQEPRQKSYTTYPKFQGCYVTLDFARGEAPVLPSRNQIEFTGDGRTEFINTLIRKVAELVPALLDTAIAGVKTPATTREVFLDCANYLLGDRYAGSEQRSTAPDHVLRQRIANLYATKCPVRITRLGDGVRGQNEKSFRYLTDAFQSDCRVATTRSVAEAGVFAAYARSKGIDQWIEVRDERELGFLRRAWKYQEKISTFEKEKEIFAYIQEFMEEIREGKIFHLLRGDYAVMKSNVLGNSMFLRIPELNNSATRETGARQRRSDTDPILRPRVAFNWNHPIVHAMEEHLETASDVEAKALKLWLDTFCDGVVEDKTIRVPAAKWADLRVALGDMLGKSFVSYDLGDLR